MADASKRVLMAYLAALADLAGPKAALLLLHDAPRLAAFQAALRAALKQQPGPLS
jgi:hypothetical protein